ncbi:TAK1-associated binding protein 2 isoform X2 [Anticarsia gemmatalis]|uniref:TAK1-associated binding protein 2 isoform X2 n=1 Tax=Anticarsia gemmatalis TaxID=129554 RepID=UPI003F765BDF
MSAPSESAASPAPCACTNISLMQLFHELKQKFPGVPDHVVSNTIELYCHDKQACEKHLHSEVKASLTHAYHASSSAAARQLNELRLNLPLKCRNQPIVKHEAVKSTALKSITCEGPQKAILSTGTPTSEPLNKLNTDANQNIVETKNEETHRSNNNTSPVTVINIDNCYAKYNAESPSDLELSNENIKEEKVVSPLEEKAVSPRQEQTTLEQPESTNYRILKSHRINHNLPERLEKGKEKKTIKKEEPQPVKQTPQEKPKRPNTLDFIKTNPGIAFKQTLKEPEAETCRTVSPAPSASRNDSQPMKEAKSNTSYRPERGYPLNLSVNVNCHIQDLSRGYGDPWLEDYDSPRAITSVNLTVCTPTSNMASPVRDTRDEDSGFEGHVTVTVSPSTARAPRRRAPPPPTQPSRLETSPRPTRVAPDPPVSTLDRSLIERQKERLERLAMALAEEKGRLAQLTKETRILAGPPPAPSATQRLRDDVERLRNQCGTLAKRLEMTGNEPDDSGNFYSNIYTGQRPSSTWQCHLCTFRNHPLLDKCEECDMPRILVVRSDGITVRLVPGRRKITRSWVL